MAEQFADDVSPKRPDDTSSKLKRTACVLCRKRKLKCDAARPKCSTCQRLGHNCEYNEVRKKSGPKRGYVKALEARLASVETQLKTSTDAPASSSGPSTYSPPTHQQPNNTGSHANHDMFLDQTTFSSDLDFNAARSNSSDPTPTSFEEESYSWDMIALGLDEPLPTPDIMDELFELYFSKIHPTSPMIHKGRFMAALNLAPQARPPIALRYAMWALAAGLSDKFVNMQEHFYHRARKYIQQDEMRGFGENIISLYNSQAWILISTFEFKNMHFPRAWLSTGRAVRLIQMLGLHRVDGGVLEVKQCISAATDWIDKEQRRRTFWMAFWGDRCASIGTGWPMTIDEHDIVTNLPASDEAFNSGQMEITPSLQDILSGRVTGFSNFAGAVVMTALFGRNLHHLHRPSADDREDDLNGNFWNRHRKLDTILLNINMSLPDTQRVPLGLPDPNVVYINMALQTCVICLHQASIFKIDKNKLPSTLSHESKIRCVTAAAEIATLMRAVSHCELAVLNPFTAFSLYVAARVFVQYLKSRRDDQNVLNSLNFLLSAMNAMKRRNPLNESFLAQIEVDLEGANIPAQNTRAAESLFKRGVVSSGPRQGAFDIRTALINVQYPYQTGVKDPRCPVDDALPAPKVMELSTLVATNMQNNVGSAASEMTLPMGQRNPSPLESTHGYMSRDMPDSSIGILGELQSCTNSSAAEEMDLSPANSGNASTPSMQTHRSGSTSGTAYTPPHTDTTDTSTKATEQPPLFEMQDQILFWYDSDAKTNPSAANAQLQNTLSYHYSLVDGPGLSPGNPLSAPASMSQQDFHNLTKQFFPSTPSAEQLENWSGSTGLTPGQTGPDDWNQILEGVVGWEGDQNVRSATPWMSPAQAGH